MKLPHLSFLEIHLINYKPCAAKKQANVFVPPSAPAGHFPTSFPQGEGDFHTDFSTGAFISKFYRKIADSAPILDNKHLFYKKIQPANRAKKLTGKGIPSQKEEIFK
ncbi:MAG: hypothetical protein ILP07_07665 [Treponema sp.]|nr:hypothetical protein [Treponema sp.]